MIPTATSIREIDNLPAQREVEFTIGNPIWVMRMMAKLYSNVEGAIAREYATNAYDSHIMAGKADVPIKVTLPTRYNPYFVVQDFGLGMSEDELCEVYTSFGDSTKRDSNEVNGLFGAGSKSAMTYTNQFIVTSVQDGMKTIASISKREDWSITLKVVSSTATDEGNGTTITIPVHNHDEFAYKARDLYRFWVPGTIEVNGEFPEQAVGEKLDDNLFFSPKPGVSYVVMGNVGYRINNPEALFRNSRMNAISFVAYVPGGTVDYTPSREDLEYNDLTKAALHKIISDFENKIIDEARSQIETAKTSQEAWQLWDSWGKKLGHSLFSDVKHKGLAFQTDFVTGDATRYLVPWPGQYNERHNTRRVRAWSVSDVKQTLLVTDYLIDISTVNKRKVKEYMTAAGTPKYKYVLFVPGDIDSPWVPKENIITWENLKAAIPKKVRDQLAPRTRRPAGLFDFWRTGEAQSVETPIPADTTKIYYVTAADVKAYGIKEAMSMLKMPQTEVVVKLAVNRLPKFVRDNPGATSFIEYAKSRVVIDGVTLLDADTKRALNLSSRVVKWVNNVDAKLIDDPEWAEIEALYARKDAERETYDNNLNLARRLGMYHDVKKFSEDRNDSSLIDKYPLLEYLNFGYSSLTLYKDEVILYLNAAYAARKGSKP